MRLGTRLRGEGRTDPVLFLVAVLAAVGCDDADRSEREREPAGVPAVVIQGRLLSRPPAIGHPSQAMLAGQYLWIRDAAGDPGLHAVDTLSGDVLRSVARKGAGPGEVAGIANIHTDPRDPSAVWVFDGTRQRLIRFAVDDSAHNRPTIPMAGAPLFFKALWLDAETGIGIAREPERRFTLFDADADPIRAVPGELVGGDSIPIEERQRASVTRFSLCKRPTGTHFAIAYGHAGRIDIHDTGLSAMIPATVPDPADANFERDRSGEIRFRRRVVRYLDCSATADELFALYSGYVFAPETSEHNQGPTVHVFDWSGQLVRMLRLEPAMSGIAIDPTGETLYGVSLMDAGVYRFRIPSGRAP